MLSSTHHRCSLYLRLSYRPVSPLHALENQSNKQVPCTTNSDLSHETLLRIHNSKTASFLNRQLDQTKCNVPLAPSPVETSLYPNIDDSPRLFLSTQKRSAQFPGTVSRQIPLDNFYDEKMAKDDTEAIIKALQVRRNVTVEILKDEMKRKGKFGITYSTNLVDSLLSCGFVDILVVAAVGLKANAEFEVSTFNVRVRAVIARMEIISLIRWLKHNGVSYPKIAKAFGLTKGNVGSIRRLAEWLSTIHVKGESLGVVLSKSGSNILERSEEELSEIVMYLEANGIRREWMGYVMSRCPQLLSYTIEEVKNRVEFYRDMGMNEKDFGTMIFDFPGVLGSYSMDDMHAKVSYIEEFGLEKEGIGRLIAFRPQLMACSIEQRWKPLVKYLHYLGISRDGMKRMLTIKPMVFCINLEDTIAPKIRFFQDIGIRDEAIGDMIVKFPPLLTYSLYKKIRPVVIFLITRAGVNEKDIAKVIAGAPELLGCSVGKKLEENMKYFLSLGLSHRQLGAMIADFPMLLRYNVDLLRPKYRYLRRFMVRPLQDLIEFPRYYSYSLEKRIIPRHKVMIENRVNFKLRYMLACTDEEFEKKVATALERRRLFESEIDSDDVT